MDSSRKVTQPLIKNRPIKLGLTFALVSIVFLALLFTGARSSDVDPNEQEPGVVIVMPDPTPEPDPTDDLDPTDDFDPSQYPDPTPEPEPEPTPMPDYDTDNPLTGWPMEESKTLQRPLAIVLSNEPSALPMNGVSSADILYEYPVEGGLTRNLAIFQDFSNVSRAGSIRSARHYTVELAESYDAILIHAGGSPQAYNEISNRSITNLDEVGGRRREIFFRDRNRIGGRRLAHLHALVTSGERVTRWLPEYNFRLTHNEDYKHGLAFTDDGTPAGGSKADRVVVVFSSAKSTTFNFNESDNVYNVYQSRRDFTDATNNRRASFTNVIVMRARVSSIPGDESGRQNIVTVGEGEGHFICGGRYIDINWSRANKSAPFSYYHKNGTPLELGRGRTFICIVPTRADVTIS